MLEKTGACCDDCAENLDEAKDPNEKLQISVPYGLTKDEKNKLRFSKFDVTQYSEPNSRGIQVPFYIGRRKNIQKMFSISQRRLYKPAGFGQEKGNILEP